MVHSQDNPFASANATAEFVGRMIAEGEDDSPLDFSELPGENAPLGTGPYSFDISLDGGDFPDEGAVPQLASSLIDILLRDHDPLTVYIGATQFLQVLGNVLEGTRALALEQAERDGHKKYRGAIIRRRKRSYTYYTHRLHELKQAEEKVKEKEKELKALQDEIAKSGGRAEAPQISGLFVYLKPNTKDDD